jgi:hypothetical protein
MITGIAPATQETRIPYGRHLGEGRRLSAFGYWLSVDGLGVLTTHD